MSIAIGADEAAFDLKEKIKTHLIGLGYEVEDYGVYNRDPVLYPDVALAACNDIAAGKHERGILICGTGIGMAISANKVPGIRAAVCHDPYSAERSRKSNDCQVMTMGARVIGEELAKTLVNIWLQCDFAGGGSTAKVERIKQIEQEYHNKALS